MYDPRALADWIAAGESGLFSVVIPARNEAENLLGTIPALVTALQDANLRHEILIVDDGSTDDTPATLQSLMKQFSTLRVVENPPPNGFGLAVRHGLLEFRGDAVAIVMADGSDDPTDVVAFFKKLGEGYDCVFGSRFMTGASITGYPIHKLILNRCANTFIRLLFGLRYNDVTNAFKCYSRTAIAGMYPLVAHHFNLTVEMPLKAIIRGYRFAVLPNSWRNRKFGISSLRIREMGSRYLFIVLYCLLEKLLSRGDYRRPAEAKTS